MIKEMTMPNLSREFTGALEVYGYSADSPSRFSRVLDELTRFAGSACYSQKLGAEFLAATFSNLGGLVTSGEHSYRNLPTYAVDIIRRQIQRLAHAQAGVGQYCDQSVVSRTGASQHSLAERIDFLFLQITGARVLGLDTDKILFGNRHIFLYTGFDQKSIEAA